VDFLPHVVAWNLTRRCNLECAHCYISAGPTERATSELDTETCLRIVDELVAVNPTPLLILSGGEPLLRDDLTVIARHAARRGATVVVGTNGTLLTAERIAALKDAGVRGVAVSVDSLRPSYHDNFRHGVGSLADTQAGTRDGSVRSGSTSSFRRRSRRATAASSLNSWHGRRTRALCRSTAISWCRPGRGRGADRPFARRVLKAVLADLARWQREFRGRMLVRSKCAPHFHASTSTRPIPTPRSSITRRAARAGRSTAALPPDGKLTPCPYLPEVAGDLAHPVVRGNLARVAAVPAACAKGRWAASAGSCEYRQICGGCRARAFAVTGDVLAADPSCDFEPRPGAVLVEPSRTVTYGGEFEPALVWSPAARERMERIPSFVRGVVMQRLEDYARRQGVREVTIEMLSEVRSAMPIDFSKRRPFFTEAT
jgi:radical SAM protein with 4Fe4S-binding SPASM domain